MSVDLVPEWTIGDLRLTSYPFGVDADSTVDIGEPDMVVESVTSMLADGDIERVVRHGNRAYVLEVYVEGPTLGELAASEALLRSELQRAGLTLTHDPGDGLTPVSVYEVQTARLTPKRDDQHESHLIRKFTLTLSCSPFARSLEPVTVAALEAGSTTVTVDDCSSATGWTGTRNGVPTVAEGPSTIWEAGAVGILELSNENDFPPETWAMARTGSIDTSTTPYLSVELTTLSAKGGAPLSVQASVSGTRLPILKVTKLADGSGYFNLVLDASGFSSIPAITFTHTSAAGYGHAWQGLSVRDIKRTNVSPGVTARQLSRVIEVGGTERTPASMHVASANGVDVLDTVIVHTCPEDGSGYSPPMRRWRVSGNSVTPTFDAMSGAYEPIHPNPVRSEVPNSALPPGGYIVAARMATDTAGSHRIAWSTSTIAPFGGANLVGGVEDVTFFNANQWIIVPLAFVTLPTIATTGTEIVTRVDVQRFSGTALINVDEVWLFRAEDDCALTVVGGVPQHLWLDSPGGGSTVPRVWLSEAATRENMRHPAESLLSGNSHVLHPDGTSAFVAAVSDTPALDATFYPRWHSNAAS